MIDFAMSKERIDCRPNLFTLPHHDVHGIMQKCVADLRARLGHEDGCLGLMSHQHWQGADVIEVGMRNQNGIDFAIGDRPKVRQSILALLLRVHPAIENDPLPVRTDIITVGADLSPTGQVDELQGRALSKTECAGVFVVAAVQGAAGCAETAAGIFCAPLGPKKRAMTRQKSNASGRKTGSQR